MTATSHKFGTPRALAAVVTILVASEVFASYPPTTRTIASTGNIGTCPSLAMIGGHLAVSFADDTNQRLKLWYDDGAGGGTADDLVANGSEIRTVDSTRTVTSGASYVGRIADYGGHIAIAYCDGNNLDLILWIDDGHGGGIAGDAIASGSEIRVIDTAGSLAVNLGITVVGGHLAVAYGDLGTSIKLWCDDGLGGGTADDGLASGGEIRTIAALDGQEIAVTVLGGNLAVAFQDFGPQDLMLWLDDGAGGGTAGDAIVNGNELRTASNDHPTGFWNSIIAYNGYIGVTFYHFPDATLRFWYDDGAGSGVAGNGIADGTEIRIIDAPSGGGGFYPSVTTRNGKLAISSLGMTPDGLRIWYDDGAGGGTASDVAANGSELRLFSGTDAAYYNTMIAVSPHLLVNAYYDGTASDLKLALLEFAVAPNAPTNLGPANIVNGSAAANPTPTLTLSQSDTNTSDTLSYQIQIDDSSDFSSPLVDFNSAAISQGSASFTVGQATGGGSYAVGAPSQSLAVGSYYWRTRSLDSTDNSGWTTANGGIAFSVIAVPTVTTAAASSITTIAAASGGDVTDAGGSTVTARGVCWSTSTTPTVADSFTNDGTGTGAFVSSISGLLPETTYYVRAYATNAAGTAYGNAVSFGTAAEPQDPPPSDPEPEPEPEDPIEADNSTQVLGTVDTNPTSFPEVTAEPNAHDANDPIEAAANDDQNNAGVSETRGNACGFGTLFGMAGFMALVPRRSIRRLAGATRRTPDAP